MSCRRAYELDLTAFLEDPRDAAWDDFRAHYPRCPECAPEVAAWTSLHAALASRHPEPAELLQWSDDPQALDGAARQRVARHVERCATCRDELRALAAFALPVPVAAAAPVAPPAAPDHHPTAARAGGRHAERRSGSRHGTAPGGAARADAGRPREAGLARRVLWHPAFAYAVLAVVILLPTFRDRFDRATTGSADLGVSHTGEEPASPPAPAIAPQDAPRAEAPLRKREEESDRVSADRHDAASAAAELRKEGAAEPEPPATSAGASEQAGPGADDALVDRTAPRLLRQAPARPGSGGPAESRAAQPAPAARAAGRAADAQTEGGGALRALGSVAGAASVRLVPGSGGAERAIVITLPEHLAGARVLEVRVRDDAGGRELRQQIERPPGVVDEVAVALPAGFTAPRLVVELYADGVGPFASGVVTP